MITTLVIKVVIAAVVAYLIGSIPTGYLIVKSATGQDIRQVGSGSTGACVLLGHSKSIYLGFTGGKSVASGVGTILALSPTVGLSIALIWAIITYASKYVSLGSIIALALSPILMFLFNQPIAYVVYCAIGAVYVIYLHRENIKRLLAGTENKVR